MVTRYISSTATNGYSAGLASGTASTPSTAWSLVYALANQAAEDTFVFNIGDYRHPSAGWVFNQSVVMVKDPSLPGFVIFHAATGAAATVAPVTFGNAAGRIYAIGTDGDSHIGEFIVDGEGTLNDGVVGSTTAGLYKVIAYGVNVVNTLVRGWRFRSPDVSLNIKNCAGTGVNSQGGFYADQLLTGDVRIENFTYGATALGGGFGGIFLLSPGGAFTGPSEVLNPSGVVNTSGNSSACIMLRSMPGVVRGDKRRLNRMTGTGSNNAVVWFRPVASNAVMNGRTHVYDIVGRNEQTGTGYGIIFGTDTTDATTNNTVNYPTCDGNDITGPGGTTLTHGIVFGWMKGGSASNNVVRRCALGILSKGQVSGDVANVYRNQIVDPNNGVSGGCLFTKGSTNVQYVCNDVIMTTGRPQTAILNAADDAGGTSTGNRFICNNVYSPDTLASAVVVGSATDASTASLMGNNYAFSASGSPWKYGAAGYTTLAEWQAAQERNAENVTPTVRSPAFHKTAYNKYAIGQLDLIEGWLALAVGL